MSIKGQFLKCGAACEGEPGKPLRRCGASSPFAPTQLFELRRCCAWLILRKEHTMLFSPKRTCFRFAARTLRVQGSRRALPQALRATGEPKGNPSGAARQLPLHRGARATPQSAAADSSPYIGEPGKPLSLPAAASSPLRTETPLRDIPVLRMAYFTIPHRPTFGAPVFRSAYSASRNARASAASRPPSSHTVLSYSKRTCFRFAARTLRVQGSQGNPSGGAAEGKTPAQEIAARALEAGNRDLYCIGGMSPCSVRAALRSWWRRAYSS